MNFGERIYGLRSKNGLSQGELAEKLGVSRQAVSKWENNSAVPDLDKLLKISELFSVSLDEIVKGNRLSDNATAESNREKEGNYSSSVNYKSTAEEKTEGKGFPVRKIFAIIFFCTAVLIAVLSLFSEQVDGFILCIPCVAFGLVCYFCKNFPLLNCVWLFYMMFEFFSTYMTNLNFTVYAIRFMFNDIRYLFMGLLALIVNVLMVVFTVRRVKDRPIKALHRGRLGIAVRWGLLVLFYIVSLPVSAFLVDSVVISGQHDSVLSTALQVLSLAENIVPLIIITAAISYTVRYIKAKSV